MKVNFYSLIESEQDKTVDLSDNFLKLFDDLLQYGGLPPELATKIAQLRAKVEIEFKNI